MGQKNAKITVGHTIPTLVRMLSELQLPDDRNQAIEYMNEIDKILLDKKSFQAQCSIFKESEAMSILLRSTKRLIEDIDVVCVCMQIIESIKLITTLIMDFIQYGGVDMLEKALRIHSKDSYLAVMVPKLLKIVLAVGASSSIEEIQQEGLNLRLCKKCQETIERAKNPLGAAAKIVVPRSSDRVSKVLKFMDNYLTRLDVQIVSLDAVINFSRNADAPSSARETEVVAVLARIAESYRKEIAVIWRTTMAYAILASYHQELAVDIAVTGIQDQLAEDYPKYAPVVQQQVLWLFSELLKWPRSKRIIHKSGDMMEFFKYLLNDKLDNEKEEEKNAIEASKKITALEQSMREAAKKKELEEKLKARGIFNDIDDDRPPLTVAIPLSIRIFMRETNGRRYKEKVDKFEKQKEFKQRRNYDERPKYGTVDSSIFVEGKDGLLPEKGDDDEGNRAKKEEEWEKHVKYGEVIDDEERDRRRKELRKQHESKLKDDQ